MAQEYKIAKVSQQQPREWTGDYGTTYYIKVMLEGHERPVEIGKKDPNSLHVGDTVFGTVTPTQYDADKFKSEKKPFAGGGGYKENPDKQNQIKAQWAIGQAVSVYKDDTAMVENFAKTLFAMVDRVKNGSVVTETSNTTAPSQSASGATSKDVVVDDFDTEATITLDDIPF